MLLEAIGEDPEAEPYPQTWQRRVPDVLASLSEGLREEEKPTMRAFETEANDLVVKTGIPFYSLCSHHLLPYYGTAHVAYRPDGSVVGLSKLTRYVRWQSRRPSMQEELTEDIAAGLAADLEATGVLVELEATHMCEVMRGIETESTTRTRASVGDVGEDAEERLRTAIDREDRR